MSVYWFDEYGVLHPPGGAGQQPHRQPHRQPHLQPHRQPHLQPHLQPHRQPHIDPGVLSPEDVQASYEADVLGRALRQATERVGQRQQVSGAAKGGPPTAPGLPANLQRWGEAHRVEAVLAELYPLCRVLGGKLQFAGARGARDLIDFSLVPSPGNSQIDKVLRAAVEREERLCEVLTQADDFWDFFCALLNLPRGAAPHTELLMDLAFRWAGIWVMGLKHQIAALRPFQLSSLVTTLLPTPQHGSLPSGHATMATLFSELLIALLQPNPTRVAQLDRMARRIAFNRVVAGVHFPLDNAAGYALGQQLAALLKAYATGGEAPKSLEFLGSGGNDLATQNELRETQSRQPATSSTEKLPKQQLLEWLWLRATEELVALKL